MSKDLPKQCNSCGGMGCGTPCEYGDDKVINFKEEYKDCVRVILDSMKKEKELTETIQRLLSIIDQQQGSTRTIELRVCEYLDKVDSMYMQSGIMDAINMGLFNSKIVLINPIDENNKGG